MFKLISFFALLALASAVEVNECPGIPAPIEVRVSGCDVLPCEFQKGETVIIEADGSADIEITAMTIKSIVTWNGIEIEIPIPDPDGCQLLVDDTCPVAPGTVVTIRQELVVPDVLPEADLLLTVNVINQNDDIIQCFYGDIKIVA